jgi:glycosyltransferase involved in cell wall biosynthesis
MDARSITNVVANVYRSGPGGARNTALDVCLGSLVAFLDADDVWLSGKISSQVDAIVAGCTFVVTGYRFDSNDLAISPPKSINNPLDVFNKRGIGTSTVLITRDLLGSNRFRDLRFAQDLDYWFRLSAQLNFVYFAIPKSSAIYSTSGSTKNKVKQLVSVLKVLSINKIGFLPQVKILFNYSLNGIITHYLKNPMSKWRS